MFHVHFFVKLFITKLKLIEIYKTSFFFKFNRLFYLRKMCANQNNFPLFLLMSIYFMSKTPKSIYEKKKKNALMYMKYPQGFSEV